MASKNPSFKRAFQRTCQQTLFVLLASISFVHSQDTGSLYDAYDPSISSSSIPSNNQTNSNIVPDPCACTSQSAGPSNNKCCPATLGSTLAVVFVVLISALMVTCCCWKFINNFWSKRPSSPSVDQAPKQSRWCCWRYRSQRQVTLWLHPDDAPPQSIDQSISKPANPTKPDIEMTVVSSNNQSNITNSPSVSTRQPIESFPSSDKYILFRGQYTINQSLNHINPFQLYEFSVYLKFDYHSNPRTVTGYGFDRSNQLSAHPSNQSNNQTNNQSANQSKFQVLNGIFTVSPTTGEHKFQMVERFPNGERYVLYGSWAGQPIKQSNNQTLQPIYLSNMRWYGQLINESSDQRGRFTLEPDREAMQRLIDEEAEKLDIVII